MGWYGPDRPHLVTCKLSTEEKKALEEAVATWPPVKQNSYYTQKATKSDVIRECIAQGIAAQAAKNAKPAKKPAAKKRRAVGSGVAK